jgi:serine/threonine protein kinase/tetratricopeptide (TPR) repeat protein
MTDDSFEKPEQPVDPDRTLDVDATLASDTVAEFRAAAGDLPETIGPYRIARRLGEGGMGEVFLARQSEPIKRVVALKIIKPGMDTRAVVARFELERQTLALMNHPAIARVYDAGQTEQGRPYFVMEYVEGVPINQYCDEKRLTTRQRLELVTEVCTGVQHAHQKAIIHRDLKPGNILVTEVDGKPVPKIIDFGIARATEQRQVERTMFTQLGHVIGTPAYMSPEQTDPTNTDIDTRTDIYSLGVVLYELLVGLTPFDTESVYSAGFDAIMKFVREQVAPKPSARLRQSGAHTTEVAELHQTEPDKLLRTLRGDLDWILLKALEKDRNRRYETASALAMDIRRYLNNEPVLASPPSAGYLARKFIRRHRGGVAVGAAAAVVLIAFTLTTSLQNRVIARERDRAELESAKATAVNDFLRDMLVATDPWSSGDHDLTVAEAMDAARTHIDSVFTAQPLVAAEMHATMGQTYLGLGKLNEAEAEVRRGLKMNTDLLGADHPDLADSWLNLAKILRLNLNLMEAIPAGGEVVRIRKLHFPQESPEILAGMDNLAELYVTDMKLAEADSVLDLMQAIIEGATSELRPQTASMVNLRARVVESQGTDSAKADSIYQVAVDILKDCCPESPLLPIYLNNLAVNQVTMGDYERARVSYAEALERTGRQFGTDHPEYALVLENLGGIAYRLGDYEDCLANLDRVREIRARKMGENHPSVMRTMLNMATVANGMGNHQRAIDLYEDLLPRLVAVNGEVNLDTATTLRNAAIAYKNADRLGDAETALARSRAVFAQLYPDGHEMLGRLDHDKARLRIAQDRWAEAEKPALEALAIFQKELTPTDVRTTTAAATLAEIYEKLGRPREAAKYRDQIPQK